MHKMLASVFLCIVLLVTGCNTVVTEPSPPPEGNLEELGAVPGVFAALAIMEAQTISGPEADSYATNILNSGTSSLSVGMQAVQGSGLSVNWGLTTQRVADANYDTALVGKATDGKTTLVALTSNKLPASDTVELLISQRSWYAGVLWARHRYEQKYVVDLQHGIVFTYYTKDGQQVSDMKPGKWNNTSNLIEITRMTKSFEYLSSRDLRNAYAPRLELLGRDCGYNGRESCPGDPYSPVTVDPVPASAPTCTVPASLTYDLSAAQKAYSGSNWEVAGAAASVVGGTIASGFGCFPSPTAPVTCTAALTGFTVAVTALFNRAYNSASKADVVKSKKAKIQEWERENCPRNSTIKEAFLDDRSFADAFAHSRHRTIATISG